MATGEQANAIAESNGTTLVNFDVSPGASETQVPSGFNEWRDQFEARLAEPAQDGRVNAELSELLDAAVRLESGASASKKRVAVSAPADQVLGALVEALEGTEVDARR